MIPLLEMPGNQFRSEPFLLAPPPRKKRLVGQQAHLALRADEAAHVLHHPDDGQLHLVAEADFFPDILERHFLARFKRPVVSKSKYKKEKV